MDEALWREVRAVFERALERPDHERDAFVTAACAGRPDLQREVARLLVGHRAGGALPPDAGDAPPQQIGKYRLDRELPAGGMGATVWLAHDVEFDRDVALKVFREGLAVSARELERFRRESASTGKLVHPHIVRVYESGRTGSDSWFAMELIDGHDLGTELRLQQERAPDEPPPILPRFDDAGWVAAAAGLVADVADALHHAHENGVLHRDVKPANLLLDRNGRVFVADFGLARDERFGTLSRTGDVKGTPYYMSPEQARVVDVPDVDHRTDVYSLGVVLYEMLTLKRPFEGRTSDEIIARIQREDAV